MSRAPISSQRDLQGSGLNSESHIHRFLYKFGATIVGPEMCWGIWTLSGFITYYHPKRYSHSVLCGVQVFKTCKYCKEAIALDCWILRNGVLSMAKLRVTARVCGWPSLVTILLILKQMINKPPNMKKIVTHKSKECSLDALANDLLNGRK